MIHSACRGSLCGSGLPIESQPADSARSGSRPPRPHTRYGRGPDRGQKPEALEQPQPAKTVNDNVDRHHCDPRSQRERDSRACQQSDQDRYRQSLTSTEYSSNPRPYAMTHRPWSELTKHWSPERKAANERAKAELRADIRQLQAQARKEGRHPGDPPPTGSSSRRSEAPSYPVASRRRPARDVDRDFGPSR